MAVIKMTDLDLRGKRVLIRQDLNVPQNEDGSVADDTRIRASLPTIKFAMDAGAQVMLMSHLGRPKEGPTEGRYDDKDSLKPVAEHLGKLLSRQVKSVGYDYPPDYAVRTMIFDPGKTLTREDNTTHHAFFPAGITVIEYLTNLDQIGAPRCTFIALPLPVEGADGSPVRAVAMVD